MGKEEEGGENGNVEEGNDGEVVEEESGKG